MYETRQDPAAQRTYRDPWNRACSEATQIAGTPVTVVAGTVTADHGAVVVSSNPDNRGLGVLFKLRVNAVPVGTDVTTTTSVTLSNGDTDIRRHVIRVTPT